MSLEYLVVCICGVCLIGILGALIFNARFRRDLTAQPGKLSLFGISVEGVVIVLLAALMLGGILYSLDKHAEIRAADSQAQARIADGQNAQPSIRLIDLPFPAETAKEALEIIQKMKLDGASSPKPNVVELVKKLKYEQSESEQIRAFAAGFIGPWAISETAKEKSLSVPARMALGKVIGCPNHLDKKFELRSRLPDASAATGERVEVVVTDVITRAGDCESKHDFIQVSCDIANKVFTDAIVECSDRNEPRWHIDIGQELPKIWFTQVPN